ncbi:MAG TPA: hypothetical protein VK249_16720 [Anaerolineales bacterium]|nr:hypothetical protein [Anaerolineales bacterium]
MPVIRITRELANTLLQLRGGSCLGVHGRIYNCAPLNYTPYCWEPNLNPDTGKVLIQNKLVRRRSRREGHVWWHGWFRTVWVVSDAGKQLTLPPEEFWASE